MSTRELLRRRGVALAAAVLVGLTVGFLVGRRTGNSADPSQLIAVTVESVKADNRLVVYRFSGDARVKSSETYALILKGDQELIVPGSAMYFIDMSKFSIADAGYDPVSRTLNIKLPPLMIGDISMRPERATTINRGVVTISNDVVETLGRKNYSAARVAFLQQARNPQLVALAVDAAKRSVTANFAVPLRAMGRGDVTIKVSM